MNCTACTIVGFACALTLAFAPAGIAQQQHQEHHPGGAPAAQDRPAITAAEGQEQAPMMPPMRGMSNCLDCQEALGWFYALATSCGCHRLGVVHLSRLP